MPGRPVQPQVSWQGGSVESPQGKTTQVLGQYQLETPGAAWWKQSRAAGFSPQRVVVPLTGPEEVPDRDLPFHRKADWSVKSSGWRMWQRSCYPLLQRWPFRSLTGWGSWGCHYHCQLSDNGSGYHPTAATAAWRQCPRPLATDSGRPDSPAEGGPATPARWLTTPNIIYRLIYPLPVISIFKENCV